MSEDQSLDQEKNSPDQTFEEIENQARTEDATTSPDSENNQDQETHYHDEEEFKPTPQKIEPVEYSIEEDFKRIFSRPLYIIAFILGVLLMLLFIIIAIDLREQQKIQALEGYVKINHHLPKDFKGKVSPEIKELLEIYKQEEEKLKEDLQLIKPDPREDLPVIGDKYSDPVTNKEVMEILQKQKVGKVDLGGAEKKELMNLSGLDLTKLDYKFFYQFIGSDVRYCDFSAIKAEALEFRGASLQYSQFVDAVLPRSNFTRSRLSYTNFFAADLDSSLFIGAAAEQAHFTSAILTSTNFTDAIILDSDFEEVKADHLIAKGSHFEGVSFRDSSLVGANFRNAILREINFANCNLAGADFENADLSGSNFEGANIEGANFKNATVDEVNFAKVQNVTYQQLNASKFLPGARNIPDEIKPKKYNWEDRITPPRKT